MFIYMYIMHILTVDASKPQIRKLIKGHAVRIKQGTGFNLIVHPTTYRLATRAFNKGKAVQVKLSPEELDLNERASESPEMMEDHTELHGELVGRGLWSSIKSGFNKAGKWIKGAAKSTGKWVKGAANTIADVATNKSTIRALKKIGKVLAKPTANALGAVVSGVPYVGAPLSHGVKNLGVVAEKAIDDPSSVGGWEGAAKTMITGHGVHGLNALRQANRGTASAYAQLAKHTKQGIDARRPITPSWNDNPFAPRSRGMGVSIVGHGGGMLGMHHGWFPPALVSQPFSANYQMSHFLPVPYQHFNSSMEVDGYSSEGDEMRGHGLRRRGKGFGLYV